MTSSARALQDSPASFNYSVFKVVAILTVVASHWFADLPLWIPTVVGLFIFTFSSALFTTRIYGSKLDVRSFWQKKLQRLLVRYWFLLVCLSVLLLAQDKVVFHWHSLVHVFGLSGFLNVFGHNESALGAGLWFFTVLLLFYATYPYLVRACVANGNDFFLPLVATAFFMFMDKNVNLGFSLWLTTLGFILGVFVGLYDTRVAPRLALALGAGSLVLILALNLVLGYKGANNALLALSCISTNLWLMKARLPHWAPLRMLAKLEGCLLEIFIIHMYLFVHPTGQHLLDFVLSLVLIVATAWVLGQAGSKVVALVFPAATARPARRASGFGMHDPLAQDRDHFDATPRF
ncbi:hypothetical protein [Massilia sp. TN1-12]|uniref:hypothetical protein n=1 Tax=Massilia paldalensis TaxID=3377675 RepID=UPI00384D359A